MPLTIPSLDDRTYTDLVEEALAAVPRYAPGWTNHNASDPGITIIELLAYFTDHFLYRLNRVTKETKLRFLQLLSGVEGHGPREAASLSAEQVDRELQQTVRGLRRQQRTVTVEDYDQLAREATAGNSEGHGIVRARSFVSRNLELPDEADRDRDVPGHVSVVGLPAGGVSAEAGARLLAEVRDHLEPRRLLATRLHVVEPFFLRVRLGARIHMRSDAGEELRTRAQETTRTILREFGSPWPGVGREGGESEKTGWPFGGALYLSEVYEQLELMDGVDYVDEVDVIELSASRETPDDGSPIGIKVGRSQIGVDSWLSAPPEHGHDRVLVDSAGRMIGIALRPYELLRIDSGIEDFSIVESSRGGGEVEPGRRATKEAKASTAPGAFDAHPEHAAGRPERATGPAALPPARRDTRHGMARERLLAQMPGVYHASTELRQLLGAFETILCEPHQRALETQIARIAMLFDITDQELPQWLAERRDTLLPWLSQWVALSGSGGLSLERRRRLLGQIVPLYAWRGTRHYMAELLRFHLPGDADIDIEDRQFRGLVLGQARVGVDAWLTEDRPFWFKVTVRMPDTGGGRTDWRERIRQVVDLAKPAHTTYDLELVESPADR